MASSFPFQAVIFDMDGVIVDSEYHYFHELEDFSDAFDLGVTIEELYNQVGASHQNFQRMLKGWLERAGRGPVTLDEADAFYEDWARDYPRDYASMLNVGVPETLARLDELGVRVALASSSPLANIKRVLGDCGIADMFEVIVSGEQFHESKPNPEIYLHTVELLGLPAEACCCVEDSTVGIAAGRAAGLTVVAKREDRLRVDQSAADVTIDSIPQLLEVFAG